MTTPAPGTYRPGPTQLVGLTGPTASLQDIWRRHAVRHFGPRVTRRPVRVILGDPAAHHAYGTTTKRRRDGMLEVVVDHRLWDGTHPDIDPTAPREGRWAFIADVALHEGLHVALDTLGKDWAEQGRHTGPFAALASGIGDRLGLPRCPSDLMPWWPYLLRPPGHYLGAYRPATELHHAQTIRALLRDLAD